MHRILLTLAALVGLAAPAGASDRRYAVSDFERVVVEGPYSVRLVIGRTTSVVASGSQQALEGVTIDVQGTTLRIRRNRNAWGGYPGRPPEPVTVMLTTRNLRSARMIGTGSLDVQGARGLRVDLSVEGSGRLRASALDADNLSLGVRGSGTLALQGTAETLTADIQGSGSLDGAGLSAETATIFAATTGDISLSARRAATVTANGVGGIVIAGNAACTLRGPGASEVRCGRAR
ncbi:MAG TPA: head GIN domain-containing protein [Allosphingosinicella sp.]|jgi:hypothetical protein